MLQQSNQPERPERRENNKPSFVDRIRAKSQKSSNPTDNGKDKCWEKKSNFDDKNDNIDDNGINGGRKILESPKANINTSINAAVPLINHYPHTGGVHLLVSQSIEEMVVNMKMARMTYVFPIHMKMRRKSRVCIKNTRRGNWLEKCDDINHRNY